MGERIIDPKFNVNDKYKEMIFLNPYKHISNNILDYTNLLEDETDIDADFDFTDRNDVAQVGISARGTNGDWCFTATDTPSGLTGASAPPIGRSGFVYTEGSGNTVSSVWVMKRNISFDHTSQDVKIDIKDNVNALVLNEYYMEYAIVPLPNETTDWTILSTIVCDATDNWNDRTFDFSAVPATSNLWVRIRYSCINNSKTDCCFSTWREYK